MPEKTRKAKKIQEKEERHHPLNKKLLAVSIILSVIIIMGAVLYQFFWRNQDSEVKFSLKAAIIDQLSEDFPNKNFVDDIAEMLEEYNFKVTYYDYTQTKVEFFKGLAKGNYGIIILRLHSALRIDGSAVDFFTSEPYDYYKYTKEQDEGLLVNGTLLYSRKQYFAFTPTFVERLEGIFPKSIVIAMGCQSLNLTVKQLMAKAFCDKGAKVYIGWSSWVSWQHSDNETMQLIKRLLYEKMTIEDAIKKAKSDRDYGAFLDFYPKSSRGLRISDLITEAQTSTVSIKFVMLKHYYITGINSVKRFNSLATTVYNWFRRFSPVKFAFFNFLISSAKCASSKTSSIHFSKSPR
jgi:ssDNA-specific exonuclease RecJ